MSFLTIQTRENAMKFAKFTLSPGKNAWSLFCLIRNFQAAMELKQYRWQNATKLLPKLNRKKYAGKGPHFGLMWLISLQRENPNYRKFFIFLHFSSSRRSRRVFFFTITILLLQYHNIGQMVKQVKRDDSNQSKND